MRMDSISLQSQPGEAGKSPNLPRLPVVPPMLNNRNRPNNRTDYYLNGVSWVLLQHSSQFTPALTNISLQAAFAEEYHHFALAIEGQVWNRDGWSAVYRYSSSSLPILQHPSFSSQGVRGSASEAHESWRTRSRRAKGIKDSRIAMPCGPIMARLNIFPTYDRAAASIGFHNAVPTWPDFPRQIPDTRNSVQRRSP
ncbi:hypothetical protein PGTUg99_026239 [Puccinia graminis f. sp. tritici]|uniref:Uncharacterized protein n=1 Tax=Puccinia graminis f. sp. tritici TaxID=56615 RepID=A0A5B0RB77_PUCGR|nr:hypothetical protein PGTUg99_026239 [Puccinia graminis f. sp. tritici]